MNKHYADNESLKKKFNYPDAKLKAWLDYRSYGFVEADLDRTFRIDFPNVGGILAK